MSLSIEERLKIIANKVGDLNKKGEVKSFSGNDNGYAKIVPIKHNRSGVAVWIHHWHNGKLLIDLTVSEKAAINYETEASRAIEIFKKFAGNKLKEMPFSHAIDKGAAKMYYIDVTAYSIDELDNCVDNLLKLYKQ